MNKSELKEMYALMFPDYPDIVTVQQMQAMLGISRHLAYHLINYGYVSALKIGKAYKIPKVSIIKYVLDEENGKEVS